MKYEVWYIDAQGDKYHSMTTYSSKEAQNWVDMLLDRNYEAWIVEVK